MAMRIESSNAQFMSLHTSIKRDEERVSVRAWTGYRPSDFEGSGQQGPGMVGPVADVVELSQEAKCTQKHRKITSPEAKISPREYVKALILKALIEKLTGRKIKLLIPGDSETEEQVETAATAQGQGQAVEPQQGWGIEIDHYVSRYEYEKTIFEAGGVVKTADGRTIIFSLEVGLSREWLEEQRTSIRLGDAERLADPLVINLSGPGIRPYCCGN